MPKVSVIIPTCNRPELLKRSMASVLAQTFTDFELIIVDDGDKVRSKDVAEGFHDPRVIYIANEPPRQGGGKSRNVGIARARGELVAFQDDDDEWLPEKLRIQLVPFMKSEHDVGFCFTAVIIVSDRDESHSLSMPQGVRDFLPLLLTRFKAFLTSTLIVKKYVLDEVGLFDESLPSHQESDLLLRITQKYKGLGIAEPLVRMNMETTRREHIGGNIERRIKGREMLLEKHKALYAKHPLPLAYHNFQIGLWYRDSGDKQKAREYFRKALVTSWQPRYLYHWLLTK